MDPATIKSRIWVLGLIPLVLSSLVNAQAADSGFGVGVKAGTAGVGLEFTAEITSRLNFRVGYNGLNYNTEVITDGSYDANISKSSGSYILDWHPWAGAFRLSGGAYSHFDNQIGITARVSPDGSVQLNNTIYDAANIGAVSGKVDFGSTVPYLGIGWGSSLQAGRNWGFTAEFGVQFQDSPSVNMNASDCMLTGALCNQLKSDLQMERAEIESELENFNLWPVLNVGVSYKF